MKMKKMLLPSLLGLTLLSPAAAFADMTPTGPQSTDTVPAELKLSTISLQVNNPMLSYNGAVKSMGTNPLLWQGTIYVPVRELAEGLGLTTTWDDKTGLTEIQFGATDMKIWLDREAMDVNGESIALGSKVILNKDDRVMVPLRPLAEQLGWAVDYSTIDWSITLTKMVPNY